MNLRYRADLRSGQPREYVNHPTTQAHQWMTECAKTSTEPNSCSQPQTPRKGFEPSSSRSRSAGQTNHSTYAVGEESLQDWKSNSWNSLCTSRKRPSRAQRKKENATGSQITFPTPDHHVVPITIFPSKSRSVVENFSKVNAKHDIIRTNSQPVAG